MSAVVDRLLVVTDVKVFRNRSLSSRKQDGSRGYANVASNRLRMCGVILLLFSSILYAAAVCAYSRELPTQEEEQREAERST